MRKASPWIAVGAVLLALSSGCLPSNERRNQHVFVKPQSQLKNRSDTSIGDWRNLSNWSKIKKGMSKAQVIRLLGHPTRRTVFGTLLHWEGYVDEAGAAVSGNVFFNSNKAGLIEPPVW